MLTPADIENAEFKRVARGKGYDCDEVDDFLDIVIVEFENKKGSEQLYKKLVERGYICQIK